MKGQAKKWKCRHCGSKDGYHKVGNSIYICNNCEKVV